MLLANVFIVYSRWFLILCLGLFAASMEANGPKYIRLRNETIATPSVTAQSRAARPALSIPAMEEPGLVLVQFTDRMDPSWREELTALGMQLLHFIPDDAFVAHTDSQALEKVQQLPYVHWLGEFTPQHKLAEQVIHSFAANSLTNLPVKLLVRTGVATHELATVYANLGGISRFHTLQFGTFAEGQVNARQLWNLALSPAVLWIEPAPQMQLLDEISTKMVAGDTFSPGSLAHVHELGFDGRGVTVAVADSGFDLGFVDLVHLDFEGRVDALFAYDNLPDASDEHSHGTHCAGIVLGFPALGETDDSGYLYGLGVAPGAHLVGQRIFDRDGQYRPPPSFEQLTRDAVRSGAYVGSNSWGDANQGRYDLTAAEFDALVRDADAITPGNQEYILEFSAGNSGPGRQTIGTPALAKNVIATGASQSERSLFGLYSEGGETMADFSSRGPTEDGRIKPDIVAPGTWIAAQKSAAASDQNAWLPISPNYLFQGGTSQAGPHVSGACAIFVQWFRETRTGTTPSPALVKAALINSADDMSTEERLLDPDDPFDTGTFLAGDTGPVPNFDEGWGRLNLETLIDSERRFDFTDQATLLRTGGVWEKRVVAGPEAMLKVTLVYTDVPGLPAAIPALVNDLDLEVISPIGLVYRGNAFADGESVSDTPLGDQINNVEGVHISEPIAGEYIIRVRGVNIIQDTLGRSTGVPEQDFALVVSGQLPLPGEGVVSWERAAYPSPTTASVRLVDQGVGAIPSIPVQVFSSTQTTPLTLTLDRIPGGSTFTGSVQLATGPAPGPANALAANHGDILTVRYVDEDPPGVRTANARVDTVPPVLTNIRAIGQFGRSTIRWSSDEPATSRVYFGSETNALNEIVQDNAFREQHALILPILEPEITYYFYVESSDQAGNTVVDTNQGQFHSFVAPRTSAALLVYTPESLFSPDGLLGELDYPDIGTWLAPLLALGLDFEVWDTDERGRTPSLEELRAYRLILWRPEELLPPSSALLSALSTYVDEGGSLFCASYDILSRLQEIQNTGFGTNVLHVEGFDVDQGADFAFSERGDPVGGGMELDLDYSEFPSGFFIDLLGIDWSSGPDHLRISTNAAPVFRQENGRIIGLRHPRTGVDSTSRVIYLSFPLEAVPAFGSPGNDRTSLMANVIEFLLPGVQGGSSLAFHRGAYTVPGNVLVEVSDVGQSGQARLDVEVWSTTAPERQLVSCFESPVRGIFRGQLVLTSPTNAPPGQSMSRMALPANDPPAPPTNVIVRLPARHGDTLHARYLDAANRQLTTDAAIDTIPPQITDVEMDPAYNEAIVYWETDKPTDALVRFGESGGNETFLTRSAFNAELSYFHEVTLTGLRPDRDYYFVVTSRDEAGNAVTDNNDDQLYLLRTLVPLEAPWSDDLEERRPGWIVFDDPSLTGGLEGDDFGFFSTRWAHGVPQNRHGVQARSGTKCWATNLEGQFLDFAITDLISPAVSLLGGNRASLRFWQNYNFGSFGSDDFLDDFTIELAQVAITVNNGATWSVLYAPTEEQTDGWEEVEVDITRYLGEVVRFRFNYQMFSFSVTDRLGWLLDDVAVDINVVPETLLVVSNNLAQATFELQGPTSFSGAGMQVRTNLPPGEYTVTWNPVTDYWTPEPQTAELGVSTHALVFTGTYTFPDENENGISDLWEERFFGSVTPRPSTQDSDQDGATDLQEFLAGTDPTDPTSLFLVNFPAEQLNRTVQISWATVEGRQYTLEGSTEFGIWIPFEDPIRATGQPLSVTLPALDRRLTYLFRVRVDP